MSESSGFKKPSKKAMFWLAGIAAVCVIGGIWIWKVLQPPFEFKEEIPTVELGAEFNPVDVIGNVNTGTIEDIEVSGTVNTMQPGEYELIYTAKNKSYPCTIRVEDHTPPSLQVKNVETDTAEDLDLLDFVTACTDISNECHASFADPDKVNTGEEGDFTLEIQAIDGAGNKTVQTVSMKRTKDTNAPVLQDFHDREEIEAGSSFETPQFQVQDDFDPEPALEIDTSKVNTGEPGDYPVIYTSRDRSGNEAQSVLTLHVKEKPKAQEPEEGKVVYLTFDDGPSENTAKILEILDRYGIKATFFVTGTNQAYNHLIQEAANKGHTIGLHTYTHNYASVYASDAAYFDDLQKISDMVESLTGTKSRLIRFPGGSSNTVSANYSVGIMSRLTQEVLKRGYQYFDWNVSSSDASGNTVDAEVIKNSATAAEADTLVILFHDSSPKTTTVDALPAIIESYQSRGYSFAGLSMDSYPAHHGVNN